MGIIQSDILIREAVIVGIKEMRFDDSLIDDMLAELLTDDLSSAKYGDKTIQQCKDWFTKTTIRVKLGLQVVQADLPCVAIALGTSPEAEATIGDVDFDQEPSVDADEPAKRKTWRAVMANDSYTLACFVHGEPEFALFLHSILLFTILRVKDAFLDQRGFMCNSFTVGPLARAEGIDGTENIYSRAITLNGKVRHSWPVRVDSTHSSAATIDEVDSNMVPDAVAEPGNGTTPTIESSVTTDLANLMDQDILLGIK
jgi:hypothetical protein